MGCFLFGSCNLFSFSARFLFSLAIGPSIPASTGHREGGKNGAGNKRRHCSPDGALTPYKRSKYWELRHGQSRASFVTRSVPETYWWQSHRAVEDLLAARR